jgi:hypothetical protein
MHAAFWLESLKGRELKRPRHRWEDNIKMNRSEIGLEVWTGFIWLRIGTSGRCCEHSM